MSSPQLGDVLTTPEQLDACPTGTVVRKDDFWIFVSHGGEWAVTGGSAHFSSREVPDHFDSVTVIWVPSPTRAEMTIDAWRIGAESVWFPHTRELVDLLHSVPIGGRVRVTVEKIGPDHE